MARAAQIIFNTADFEAKKVRRTENKKLILFPLRLHVYDPYKYHGTSVVFRSDDCLWFNMV